MNKIKFRCHTSSLKESMKTLMEFNNIEDMVSYIFEKMLEYTSINIIQYDFEPDKHTNWHCTTMIEIGHYHKNENGCYYVDNMHLYGFCDIKTYSSMSYFRDKDNNGKEIIVPGFGDYNHWIV